MHNTETPNPIVNTTALRAFPGWEVAEYADGTFAASNTNGYGWTCAGTFAQAVQFARDGGERSDTFDAMWTTDDTLNLDSDGEYYDARPYVNPNL